LVNPVIFRSSLPFSDTNHRYAKIRFTLPRSTPSRFTLKIHPQDPPPSRSILKASRWFAFKVQGFAVKVCRQGLPPRFAAKVSPGFKALLVSPVGERDGVAVVGEVARMENARLEWVDDGR
jgi:hypothetical protein